MRLTTSSRQNQNSHFSKSERWQAQGQVCSNWGHEYRDNTSGRHSQIFGQTNHILRLPRDGNQVTNTNGLGQIHKLQTRAVQQKLFLE